jgi:GTPase
MKAWDRVDLILKIFALHAVSPESKLQIELAAIKHMWPRIFGMGMELSRQGGWSKNAKGQWETNTEIMKRHLREKERVILEKLKTYERTRALHRENRKRNNLPTVGIVGYTNAGKSSLFNALTKKWVLAEDKLFATLGTSVGKFWIEKWEGSGREILLNDTIGFIRDLPPDLIAAFTSTLEDSILSDLLFHVVDASDPWIDEKIEIVDQTLEQIWAEQRRLYVFNKADLISEETRNLLAEKYENLSPIFVSAESDLWLEILKNTLSEYLSY